MQIHVKRREPHVIIGAAGQLVWTFRPLPGAGAQQYAFETYGTPIYDFALGNGATFIRRPLHETQPAQWVAFTSPIVANPPLNIFQGQIATQPLTDPNTAAALGMTVDGAIAPDAYNTLQPAGPAAPPVPALSP